MRKVVLRALGLAVVVATTLSAPPELHAEEGCTPCSVQQADCRNVGGTTPESCYRAYIICTCMVCNNLCNVVL